MTRTAPVYTVRWRSQVVRQRLGPPTPAPNAVSKTIKLYNFMSLIRLIIFMKIINTF